MKCLVCHNEMNINYTIRSLLNKNKLCQSCESKLDKIDSMKCKVCSKPNTNLCDDCKKWNDTVFLSNISIYKYNKFMKGIINNIKREKNIKLISIFKNDIKKIATKEFKDYIVIPIPLTDRKKKERLFNQSYELSKYTGLEIYDVLIRIDNLSQAEKNYHERVNNPPTFIIKKDMNLNGKKVLIIDDIYTTGMTLYSVVKVLEPQNVATVSSITLVRA